MTATFQTVDTTPPDAGIRRDRWGRYLLPHPDTGKDQAWTRVTTLAGTLADRFGLEKWAQRNIVYGLGQRQDLYARAAAARLEDKDTLTRVVEEAQAAAADKAGANLGSAIHQFTERIDRGEQVNVPAPYDRDVAAYLAALDAAGIAVVMGWVEKVVCVPELDVVGTLDRAVEGPWATGRPRIADVKTGKDVVTYGMTEIALQLALYAHATHWWDGNCWQPMIPVDTTRAVVIHLPVGQGCCTLYEVDIAAGWEAVQLAVAVRAWRKRRDLAQQIPTLTAPAPVAVSRARHAWVAARVDRIKDTGHGPRLAALWSQHPEIPTYKNGGPRTDTELETIIGLCDQVEADTEMPFGPSDPTAKPVTKATMKRSATTNG